VRNIDNKYEMRPSEVKGDDNQVADMQYEIEKYNKEIELLKLKLQFKH